MYIVMKSTVVYCAFLLFAAVLGDQECGNHKINSSLDVGSDAQPAEFPWLVRLEYKDDTGKILKNSCAGSLINTRYVLTSAVCAVTKQAGVLINIVLGEHDLSSENDCDDCALQKIEIESIKVNEYNRREHTNDVALIKLKEDAKLTDYVQPICLPFEEQANVGDTVVTSGWGATKNQSFTNLKKKVISTVITNEECQKKFKNVVSLVETHLCTEVVDGNQDATCAGDSGGPVAFLKNGRWYQQGIVSFGVGCGLKYPDVNMNVAKYLKWIVENQN